MNAEIAHATTTFDLAAALADFNADAVLAAIDRIRAAVVAIAEKPELLIKSDFLFVKAAVKLAARADSRNLSLHKRAEKSAAAARRATGAPAARKPRVKKEKTVEQVLAEIEQKAAARREKAASAAVRRAESKKAKSPPRSPAKKEVDLQVVAHVEQPVLMKSAFDWSVRPVLDYTSEQAMYKFTKIGDQQQLTAYAETMPEVFALFVAKYAAEFPELVVQQVEPVVVAQAQEPAAEDAPEEADAADSDDDVDLEELPQWFDADDERNQVEWADLSTELKRSAHTRFDQITEALGPLAKELFIYYTKDAQDVTVAIYIDCFESDECPRYGSNGEELLDAEVDEVTYKTAPITNVDDQVADESAADEQQE